MAPSSTTSPNYDLVIVGMGSAGIVAAEFAARLGVRTAVVESARVGGDCLWTGCVPSKALLASARVAQQMRAADRYGLRRVEPEVDLAAVWQRMRGIQEGIAQAEDNPQRFRDLGVEVVEAPAHLLGAHTLEAGGRTLRFRFALLCTGSHPATPALPGLAETGYLTSETVFASAPPPASVVFLGGGPMAMELAQALNRLGVKVTVLQSAQRCMTRDEPELVTALTRRLSEEGVAFHLGVRADRVGLEGGEKVVHGWVGEAEASWRGQELFVAVGRRPNLDGLGLEAAGVRTNRGGIQVDERLRTSVRSIYAAGDVVGGDLFTHAAGYGAAQAVRDMFLPGRGRRPRLVPWCTFTDPELAHAGLTIEQAKERYGAAVGVWRADLTHSDRARTDGVTEGGLVIVTARQRMVGAHILAPAAGEMIHELALAIRQRMRLSDLAGLVHVYPTLSTGIGRLAGEAALRRADGWRWLISRKGHS